ncbi:hypothetical protein LR090_00955 [Candidatus Bipolaricaulota bacterium]|nr:hypothetical protein [Candidatus Bipolaricaulota bacterium]
MTPEELLREVAMLDYGNPSKLESALRLAAALAFVAHRGLDRFGLQPFSDRLGPRLPLARGRGQLARILETLARLTPQGDTDFLALREWAESGPEPGLAVVISDFLAPQGIRGGLGRLARGPA